MARWSNISYGDLTMKNDDLIKLGDCIRKKAQKKYKSNVEFADSCDVNESTIRRIYRGEQNLTYKILKMLCDALDIKLSDLFKEIGK